MTNLVKRDVEPVAAVGTGAEIIDAIDDHQVSHRSVDTPYAIQRDLRSDSPGITRHDRHSLVGCFNKLHPDVTAEDFEDFSGPVFLGLRYRVIKQVSLGIGPVNRLEVIEPRGDGRWSDWRRPRWCIIRFTVERQFAVTRFVVHTWQRRIKRAVRGDGDRTVD